MKLPHLKDHRTVRQLRRTLLSATFLVEDIEHSSGVFVTQLAI